MGVAKYAALIQALSDCLCKKGFRRRFLGFNRPGADEDCFEVLTIQRGITRLVGQFTIELGVYVPKIQALTHPAIEAPAFPHAIHATFRQRLGQLAGWRDHWWKSDKKDDLLEIEMLLDRYGWPFLARWNSRERIVASLLQDDRSGTIRESFATVVVLQQAGLRNEARRMVNAMYQDFRSRNVDPCSVLALAERLKLEIEA